MRSTTFWPLLGLMQHALASCSLNCTLDTVVPSKELVWCPCYDGFFCAKLQVPLDYQATELGLAAVPLVKYAAQANSSFGEYQGMILLNPGGPGESGVEEALSYATTIQGIVGSNFDIVGFDPRGIYYSEPVANCSLSTSTPARGLSARSVPRMADDYYDSWIAYGKELGVNCEAEAGGELDAGTHMSTATTARDMLSIVDAFAQSPEGQAAAKPSQLLNYYGVSYGTFLGATFASMFPDKVGNVVLDGVVSAEGYLENYTWSSVTHLDGVISAFFIYCYEAGPSGCSFYTGSSAKDIYNRFNQSFIQLDAQKAAAENWSNASDINTALLLLKVGLLTTAAHPIEYFSLFPDVLAGLEGALATQNISAWTEEAETLYNVSTVGSTDNLQYSLGILCSDMENRWYNKKLDDLRPLLVELDQSSIAGDIWIKSMLGCVGWSIKATETFQGPFGGDTATPILFVSNTYDPVTPLENALSAAPKYKDAQILTVDGMGHTLLASESVCAFSKVAAYFQTGALPGNDSFCAFEPGTLALTLDGTLKETIAEAGLSILVD